MGKNKKKLDDTSDVGPPVAQKRTRSSLPSFRMARSSSEKSTSRRTSRRTTIKRNSRGRRGHETEDRLLIVNESEKLPDEAVTDPPLELHLPDLEQLNYDCETQVLPEAPNPTRKRQNASTKLLEWLVIRQSCLDELLRHDGLGDSLDNKLCISCQKVNPAYKCKDCFDGSLLRCQECLVSSHKVHPLHRIEYWNGQFFAATTLQNLGLRVQLGHGGAPCALPSAGPEDFCIFDISGVHYVSVDFCGCRESGTIHSRIQLLRARWFPATFDRPQTAFTFESLDTFHELTLQGKTSLYDFYHTVLHKTDNLELNTTIYRYPELHRVFRIWRNLLMLKRAGRGQDPDGAIATTQGELAVECPACPHPDRNLPKEWQSAGPLLFLYTQFLAVDANFKLKGKDRGIKDLDLTPGWASFVDDGRYHEHIAQYVDQSEINTCQSEHDALVRAAVRCTPGYSVTGVGLCVCPRHCLVRRNGAGDLQKGERYCNMDYIVLSSLAGVKLPRVVITYDIGCQWSKNLRRRMEEFPDDLKLDPSMSIEIGIPNWHINGHGENCKIFGLSYMDGVGRTCGEEVETTWAQTNALGASTREMGPGARHETLNDHWSGLNFRKIVGFRSLFLKRLREAYTMRDKQRLIYQQLSSTFPPETVRKWGAMVLAWKTDKSKPNPYKEPASSTTLQDVRLDLAREEAAEAARGHISSQNVTLTTFLTTALDLEEQQRHLQLDVSQINGPQTTKQLADLEERRTALRNRIQRWRQTQLGYMPCVASLVDESLAPCPDDDESLPIEPAESIPLHLPSSLSQRVRQRPELSTILEKECRLRIAQADDALAEIRHQRRIISGLWQFKKLNTDGTGNRACTRMRALYNRFNNRTQRCSASYRAARSALLILDPNGDWQFRLQELRNNDIRGPGKDDTEGGNGRYEPSWIWLVPRVPSAPDMEDSEQVLSDSLRVEWAKVQARKERWEEEVLLIHEEMRRVVMFYEWKAGWWRSQATRRMDADAAIIQDVTASSAKQHKKLDATIIQGVTAYAEKQASLCESLARCCVASWLPVLEGNGPAHDWEAHYLFRVEANVYHTSTEKDVARDDVELGGITAGEGSQDTYMEL